MWILQLLPTSLLLWFVNTVLLAGAVLTIAGWFAHRVPLIAQYRLPFQILGAVLLVTGVYLHGGYAAETEWRQRVAAVEKKLADAQVQSEKVNVQIQEKIVYRDRVIREKGQTLIEYVEKQVSIPAQCEQLPAEIIDIHNQAALMNSAARPAGAKE